MFGFGNKFDKQMTTATKSFVSELGELEAGVKKLKNAQDENVKLNEKQNKQLKEGLGSKIPDNLLSPDAAKSRSELKGNIASTEKDIKQGGEDIQTLKDSGPNNEESFKKLNDTLFKISDKELAKRQEFDAEMKSQRALLAAALKADPSKKTEIDKQSGLLDIKQGKEQKRRDKQQTSIFKKGFKGLGNKLGELGKNLKGKAGFALKTGLFIAAFAALSLFLQSPMFKKVTKFIYSDLIPAVKSIFNSVKGPLGKAFNTLKDLLGEAFTYISEKVVPVMIKLFNFIMKPGGVFDIIIQAIKNLGTSLAGVFDIIVGLFTGDTGLMKEGIDKLFDGVANLVGDLFSSILGLLGFSEETIAPIKEFFGNFFGGIIILMKDYFGNIIDAFGKIFSGDITGGIIDLLMAPFKMLGSIMMVGLEKLMDMILHYVNKIPFLEFENPFKSSVTTQLEQKATDEEIEMRKAGISAAGYDLDKKIDISPDSVVPFQRDTTKQGNNTVVNSTNVNNGGDTHTGIVNRVVKDQSAEYAQVI